jgi:DNA invertase Pin-like site-specific DNA recombinase
MIRRLLPSSPAELRGLRARRYVRVSTEEQGAKYGPERQHEEIDRSIGRLGLAEAGPAFMDEQSAWSRSAERPALRELVSAAIVGAYDVLVVAYFSRWSRDVELSLRLRRELHDAGVVVWFADESFASSDDDSHERYLDEAVAAEKYSHRLSRQVRKTLAAKFERYGDQAGTAGFGFLRTPQPEARLAIDPAEMPRAVGLFERYAVGDLSYRELAAQSGLGEAIVRAVLVNPLYAGWSVRHRRRPDEQRLAAPWRSSPPVSDELWARVAEVRAERAKAAGRARTRHVHLLAKRLWCHCGRAVKADTSRQRNGTLVRRYVHQDCALWSHENVVAHRLDGPIAAQVGGIRLDAVTLARIRAIAGQPAPADTDLRRAQLERDLRVKAGAHAARRLTTEAYLAEHARLTAELDALASVAPSGPVGDADEVVERLRDIAATWAKAELAARAQLVARLYRRITVVDGRIQLVALSDEAKRLGLVLAMSETVAMARPAGARRGEATVVRIPIEGRDEWLRAARRSA